jgi:hypothetical protein
VISDVLWDALSSIDRELVDYPEVYAGDLREHILMVRAMMRALQAELDGSRSPEWRKSDQP